jgi:hypothetical protein
MAFAYSVAPTAGVGTISIAKGSTTVTGVGTNFTSPALGGQLIIVNGFTARVLSVANATTMTINRAPTYAITGETFQRNANFNILATGTETSLAGLAALAGVTVTRSGTQLVYDMGVQKLIVSGAGASLSWNALTECLVFAPEVVEPEIQINAGTTVSITGNRTDGTYTAPFYPRALGMPRVGTVAGTQFNPVFRSIVQNGTFTLDGVWIDNNVVTEMTSGTTITNCKWTNTNQSGNFRTNSTNININGLALHRANLTLTVNTPDALNGIEFYDSVYVPNSLPAVAPSSPRIYTDWNFLGSTPFMNNFSGNANYVEFVNLGDWDGLRLASNANVQMAARLAKAVSLSVIDSASAGIDNAIVYRLDTNNGNRGTFYTADEHFIQTTSGGAASGKILAQVGRLPAGAAFNSTIYVATMDFRNAANNGTGSDVLRYVSYEHLLSSRAINTKGTGTLSVEQTLFDDTNVTLSRADAIAKLASSFTVNATTKVVTVTANSTFDDVYDVLKAYKATANAVNLATPNADALIVTPNGTQLTGFNDWTLVVNNGVTLDEGDKFKFVQFTNITNNGLITGVYGSDAGVSKILEVAGVTAGASVYVGNDSTGITTLFVDDADQESYRVYFEPGATPAQLVARELYGFQRFEQVVTLQDGLNVISLVDIEDVGIDEPSLATVLAYTDINTGSKFYDRTAAFRLTEQGIKKGQIATRSGFAIELDEGVGVLVNQNATLIYSLASGLITIKALSFEADTRYNTIIAVPPATVEADTNEVISIAVEDANGDSSVDILGGDGTFELYKVTEATPTADFAQGELLDTVSNGRYRFISAPGFDIVGVDINSNIRRRSSMSKGIYEQAFFVGEQIQLAQAPQVLENSIKLDILKVDLDAIKGQGFAANLNSLVAIGQPLQATDYTAPDNATIQLIDNKVQTLENAPTVSDIEASTVLAKESTVTALGTPLQAGDYVAPDNTTITAIDGKVDAIGTPLQAGDYIAPDNATITAIDGKIDNLDTGATLAQIEGSAIIAKESTVQALGTPLQASDYVAPDNATIAAIDSKIDAIDLTEIAEKSDVISAKDDIKKHVTAMTNA